MAAILQALETKNPAVAGFFCFIPTRAGASIEQKRYVITYG